MIIVGVVTLMILMRHFHQAIGYFEISPAPANPPLILWENDNVTLVEGPHAASALEPYFRYVASHAG